MSKQCEFEGCDRKHVAKGLCATHYAQRKRGAELTPIRAWAEKPDTPEGYRYCPMCESIKKVEHFYRKSRTGYYYSYCRACNQLNARKNEQLRKEQAA